MPVLVDGYCTLGVDREYTLAPEDLLRAMDIAGVDMALVATVPRHMAVDNDAGNAYVLQAASRYADRLIPACTANPWLGEEAVTVLRRALAGGARMLVLDPVIQGFGFGDDLAFPLVEVAAEQKVPVYVHTGGYQYGTPCQLGLVAARFPGCMFVMGHAGSTDFKIDAVEVTKAHENIFLETSLARPSGAADAVAALGDGKVIMGSAAPLNDLLMEWEETRKLLPPERAPGFYGATLMKLLEEDTP